MNITKTSSLEVTTRGDREFIVPPDLTYLGEFIEHFLRKAGPRQWDFETPCLLLGSFLEGIQSIDDALGEAAKHPDFNEDTVEDLLERRENLVDYIHTLCIEHTRMPENDTVYRRSEPTRGEA